MNHFSDHTLRPYSFRNPFPVYFRIVILLVLLISLLCTVIPPVSSLPAGNVTSYSFVHLSDTQNLATRYPATYNLTFSYLESVQQSHNISAIILTGDFVNTWNRKKEWDAYARARNHTSIPVYGIAGNHDTDYGNRYQYYTRYTGEPAENYVIPLGDFDLVGINYVKMTISPGEISRIRAALSNSSRSFAIIATHYYMNNKGELSPLGKDIGRNLIVKPSLVLAGHVHADFLRRGNISGFPVIEDVTNYQKGLPGGNGDMDYSAGTLYSVTSVDGQVETITARVIHIWPFPSFEEEIVVYDRHHPALPSSPEVVITPRPFLTGTPARDLCSGDLFCTLHQKFQLGWTRFLDLNT